MNAPGNREVPTLRVVTPSARRAATARGAALRITGPLARRTHSRREAAAAISRLAALTTAGVATGDALSSSAASGNALVVRLDEAVRRGSALSSAMAATGMPFLDAEIAVVRAGERGGSVSRALTLLAARLERDAGGRRRIASALAYPCILACGAFAALCFLSIEVLPSFTSLYQGRGVELPLATRALLAFGDDVRSVGPWGVPALAAAVAMFAAARSRSRRVAVLCDRFALAAPLVGALVAPRAAGEACALIALLLDAGCEADEALGLAVRAASNRVVAARISSALRALRHGVPLSRAWPAASMDRSGDAASLLEIAEATGGYAQAFARMAALEEAAAERALALVCRLAEPTAVIAMAVAVGGGVLALYQPMLGSASLLLGGSS
ncbi:MAG TPA: type II secretion system F family protein [Candidatus Binatia bacterium]|jgi:type II secretory pathway component PulF